MKKIKKKILLAVDYLLQNPTTSIRSLCIDFGIDRSSVTQNKIEWYKNLKQENLFESHRENDEDFLYYFEDKELEILNYYIKNSDNPRNDLKNKFSNAPDIRTIRRWMDILGKEYHTGICRKYKYNENKFNTIETEEDAYWLGFITADGCIIKGKWLGINLAEKDTEHLFKFGKYLGLSNESARELIKSSFGGAYNKSNPISCVKVCCNSIINNLIDKGIIPQKSGKEKPYICKTKELELAYIRGLIDGDGFLGSTQNRIGIVGSYEICEYVYNYINNNIVNISNNHIREHGTIFKLEINNNEKSKIIIKTLYNNANIYLQRKYDLYLERYN